MFFHLMQGSDQSMKLLYTVLGDLGGPKPNIFENEHSCFKESKGYFLGLEGSTDTLNL